MRLEEARRLSFSEYANILMKEHNISFGKVFRGVNEWYSITADEDETNVVDALWELNEDRYFNK